ncbi:MAG TPA: hypothetical protein VN809_14170 [Telmatospirillum sp.]|nr:hypothetical protein [Telmatospirillum sp.]
MTEREFQRLMVIYGAEIGRWPVARQADAEKWLAENPKARTALGRMAEMDRLLLGAAPLISSARIDGVFDTLSRETALISQPRSRFPVARFVWPQWNLALKGGNWAPKGAIYLGLFFLGCAANVAVRLMAAVSPLDLWFFGNLSLPLGG